MGGYNVWCKWHPLRTVMLGSCHPIEFYDNIRNDRIRSALQRITEETLEDLDGFERVLRDFGCRVIRPIMDPSADIMDWVNEHGMVKGQQGVPRSPLQPRDDQMVLGDRLLFFPYALPGIEDALLSYNSTNTYRMPYTERTLIEAPSVTVVGRDVYADQMFGDLAPEQEAELLRYHPFRINSLRIGGHNDGCFHTLKPGAILSLCGIQRYANTFPGWDIGYLQGESWEKIQGFMEIKDKVNGKWWVPGEESNDELIHFVETWLRDWVGYVEESVFDVNVLMLDDRHVCVSNHNEVAFGFFRKHGIEPIVVPWRHRYFWDGGLHCITLDLYRDGGMEDYFPDRTEGIRDQGYD